MSARQEEQFETDQARCAYSVTQRSTALKLSGLITVESLLRLRPDATDSALLLEWDAADPGSHFLVDMSGVTYIDLPALLMLSGIAAEQSDRSDVRLRLPISPDVYRFLIRWNYVRAFADAVGIGGSNEVNVLYGQTLDYHAIAQEIAAQVEIVATPTGEKVPLLPRNYYEIKSFPNPHTLSSRFAEDIARAWNEPHVARVLQNIMGAERGRWIAQSVIREMLDNALIHPRASVIQHGAQHEKRSYLPLKVVLWDNGDSIVSTLRAAMLSGPVVGPNSTMDDLLIRVSLIERHDDGHGERIEMQLDQRGLEPTDGDPDWRILLSALMPGVSSGASTEADSVGLGLHRIALSVTRRYGGIFEIRTRDIFLRVRPSRPSEARRFDYSVDIEVPAQDSVERPGFRGNLLSVSLPSQWDT